MPLNNNKMKKMRNPLLENVSYGSYANSPDTASYDNALPVVQSAPLMKPATGIEDTPVPVGGQGAIPDSIPDTPGDALPKKPNFRSIVKSQLGERKSRPDTKKERMELRRKAIQAAVAQLGGDVSKLSERAQGKVKDKTTPTKPAEPAPLGNLKEETTKKETPPRGPERRAHKLERKKIRRGILPKKKKKLTSSSPYKTEVGKQN